jgi:uncharacterized membrane-anchored protein
MFRGTKVFLLGLALSLTGLAQAKINFIDGPATVNIGDVATIQVPKGWSFVPKESMKEFDEASKNLYVESELGVLLAPEGTKGGFWAFFDFNDSGYIKDAASEKLDGDEMLKNLKDGDTETNKERKEKGYAANHIDGWKVAPHYSPQNQRLEWAYTFSTEGQQGSSINYNTRILGRRGVMNVVVVPTGSLDDAMPVFNQTIAGFDYKSGNRYAEYKDGDKIAKYGLAALVVGGAAAAAASSGLLAKFFKLIVLAVVAVFSAIKKFFNKIMGRGEDDNSGAPKPPAEKRSEGQPSPPDSPPSNEG